MRLKKSCQAGCEFYTEELRTYAGEVLDYACNITKLRGLLREITEQANSMKSLFLTKEEQEERGRMVDFFDERMQSMTYYTAKNRERYQLGGWRELMNEKDSQRGIKDGTE